MVIKQSLGQLTKTVDGQMTDTVRFSVETHLKVDDDWATVILTVSRLPGREIELGRIARSADPSEETIHAFKKLTGALARDWVAAHVAELWFPDKCEGRA